MESNILCLIDTCHDGNHANPSTSIVVSSDRKREAGEVWEVGELTQNSTLPFPAP